MSTSDNILAKDSSVTASNNNSLENAQIDDMLRSHQYDVSRETMNMVAQNYGLIERLFSKRQMYKTIIAARVKEATTEFELRHKMQILLSELKTKALEAKCESDLQAVKIRCGKNSFSFAMSEFNSLCANQEKEKTVFQTMMDKAEAECELKKNSVAYEPRKKSIEEQTMMFYQVHSNSLKGFHNKYLLPLLDKT